MIVGEVYLPNFIVDTHKKNQSQNLTNNIPSNTDANYLNNLKEMLFLIHEIEIGLLTETDRLGQELYKLYGFKMKWNDITTQLVV
jgi:hypothetical protein